MMLDRILLKIAGMQWMVEKTKHIDEILCLELNYLERIYCISAIDIATMQYYLIPYLLAFRHKVVPWTPRACAACASVGWRLSAS